MGELTDDSEARREAGDECMRAAVGMAVDSAGRTELWGHGSPGRGLAVSGVRLLSWNVYSVVLRGYSPSWPSGLIDGRQVMARVLACSRRAETSAACPVAV